MKELIILYYDENCSKLVGFKDQKKCLEFLKPDNLGQFL